MLSRTTIFAALLALPLCGAMAAQPVNEPAPANKAPPPSQAQSRDKLDVQQGQKAGGETQALSINIPFDLPIITAKDKPTIGDQIAAHADLMRQAAQYCRALTSSGLACLGPKLTIGATTPGPDGRLYVHGSLEAAVGTIANDQKSDAKVADEGLKRNP